MAAEYFKKLLQVVTPQPSFENQRSPPLPGLSDTLQMEAELHDFLTDPELKKLLISDALVPSSQLHYPRDVMSYRSKKR